MTREQEQGPELIREWRDEGAPRAVEPQTPAEKLTEAADKVVGVLRSHLANPNVLGRGESHVAAQQFRDAVYELTEAWDEFDPGAKAIARGYRQVAVEDIETAERSLFGVTGE